MNTNKDFWKDFDKLFVGMDQLFDRAGALLDDSTAFVATYPPYNTIKTEDGYRIELAVAGYALEDIEVLVDNKVLTISGKKKTEDEKSGFAKILHMGLAKRAFTKKFLLSEIVDKDSVEAALKDGILSISLKVFANEDQKARKVKVKG